MIKSIARRKGFYIKAHSGVDAVLRAQQLAAQGDPKAAEILLNEEYDLSSATLGRIRSLFGNDLYLKYGVDDWNRAILHRIAHYETLGSLSPDDPLLQYLRLTPGYCSKQVQALKELLDVTDKTLDLHDKVIRLSFEA